MVCAQADPTAKSTAKRVITTHFEHVWADAAQRHQEAYPTAHPDVCFSCATARATCKKRSSGEKKRELREEKD
jgi:hypothetical protein